jgi:hypothetical protein
MASAPAFPLHNLVVMIIVFLLAETIIVCAYRARARCARWYAPAAGNLAGVSLLLGLAAALADAGTFPVLATLTAALFAHIFDLRLRLPAAKSRTETY